MKTTKLLIPSSKYKLKQPYAMKPKGVTVHNTWNTATALAEASYMTGNKLQTSFHWVVDETQAVQCATMVRNCWHAGDGNGKGNRKTIGVEIARSRSDLALFKKAEKNGVKLVAKLLKDHGWTTKQLYKHQDWSGKYCPHRTLDLGWKRFVEMVEKELKALKPAKKAYAGLFPLATINSKSGTKDNIKRWQRFLNWYVGSRLVVDGSFGPKTISATKKAQKLMGLTQDGSAGPNTRAKAKTVKR